MQVSAGAYVGQKLSKPSTHLSEVVGLLAAVIILLFTFGTVVAMGMPIITAIIALISGLSVIGLLSQVIEVPTVELGGRDLDRYRVRGDDIALLDDELSGRSVRVDR